MTKNKTITSLLLIMMLFISLLFTACNETKKQDTSQKKKIITVSTFFLYDIAKYISEDTFDLLRIIPSGVDVHSFEPTPKIMAKVESSDLIFYSGAGLEPWITSFNFKTKAIEISKYINLKTLDKGENNVHDHSAHAANACNHSSLDPHIWFDVENMKRTTDIITYEFITLQPQHKALYLKNRDKYIKMLENIDAQYKAKLATCSLSTIITDHNAFSYLSSKYGFEIKTLSGLSSDKEVSPKDIIRVLNNVEEFKVPIVFFENFGNDKSMATLAAQANVEVDSLHPLGNTTKDDTQNNRTYEDIMLQNLEKISKALACQ